MVDIFISYSRQDAAKAEAVERYLLAQGWSVWRDHRLQPAQRFGKAIQAELDRAGCVVVLWSRDSIDSDYVVSEARDGLKQDKLVQAWLDNVDLPKPFGEHQVADLTKWRGAAMSSSLGRVAAGVAGVLEPPTSVGLERHASESIRAINSPLLPSGPLGRKSDLEALSSLFAFQVLERAGVADSRPADLLAVAMESVVDNEPGTVLRIDGHAGTGADIMLACLYWHQLREHLSGSSAAYPVWVNLRDYDGLPTSRRLLLRHLERIDRFLDTPPSREAVLLIAGFDCFTVHRNSLQRLVSGGTAHLWRVVAMNRGVSNNGYAPVDAGPIPGTNQRRIRLGSVQARTNTAKRMVNGFAKRLSNGTTASELMRLLRVCHFSGTDIGTLSAASQMVSPDDGDDTRAGDFFRLYVAEELLPSSRLPVGESPLATAAEYAYEYTINGALPDKDAQCSAEWDLVHHGETMRRFLVGHRIAESAMREEHTKADTELLRRPYAHHLTRFTPDVINASKHSKARFVKRAQSFFTKPDPDTVANMSFLLGRLQGADARRRAHRLLKATRDKFLARLHDLDSCGVDDDEVAGLMFSLRTLYVSLIYLGDQVASEEYIGHLLDDQRWNRINRGFHLEYYGDIEIMPTDALHEDPATEFHRTYERLMEKIGPHLAGIHSPHFDLDVFTLYSLAQYRHYEGTLVERHRKKLLELAPKVRAEVKSKRLSHYLEMMARNLRHECFRSGRVIDDLYRIKAIRREGWRLRKVRRPESIADHMYGAFLLAFCYLPLTGDAGYNRDRVLKLLLIHDLAESETGDIVGKTQAQAETESRWFAEAALLSTYRDLAGIGELGDLWSEYEQRTTINARIARDFDKLDQLAQLYIYMSQIPDFESWKKELEASIKTAEGGHVAMALAKHFGPVAHPQRSNIE